MSFQNGQVQEMETIGADRQWAVENNIESPYNILAMDDVNVDPGQYADLTYVELQISRIPKHGDDARWRLATHLKMFDDLADTLANKINEHLDKVDDILSAEQRQAVDNFVIGYNLGKSESEMNFPECHYVALGLELDYAITLGNLWRRGELLPKTNHPECDRLSDRLNQLTQRRSA